ncbi:hypothetical protein [Chryseobacterium sp. S90]|uniref:hypothetical protein n=1 Tax=Chryseobacterium sp. S90 TaxID=3395373 RepID=UPI0039BCCD93
MLKNLKTILKPEFILKKDRTDKIEFKNNGLYILYNTQNLGHLALDQCDILSTEQWKKISNDVLDLTSENYYKEQPGYKYELKKVIKALKIVFI